MFDAGGANPVVKVVIALRAAFPGEIKIGVIAEELNRGFVIGLCGISFIVKMAEESSFALISNISTKFFSPGFVADAFVL